MAQVALQLTGQPFPHGMLNVQWLDGQPDMRHQVELVELQLRDGQHHSDEQQV